MHVPAGWQALTLNLPSNLYFLFIFPRTYYFFHIFVFFSFPCMYTHPHVRLADNSSIPLPAVIEPTLPHLWFILHMPVSCRFPYPRGTGLYFGTKTIFNLPPSTSNIFLLSANDVNALHSLCLPLIFLLLHLYNTLSLPICSFFRSLPDDTRAYFPKYTPFKKENGTPFSFR
jgi:hypothetical protein